MADRVLKGFLGAPINFRLISTPSMRKVDDGEKKIK